jgi:hypothetical protein
LFKNGLTPDSSGSIPLVRGVPLGYSDQIYANAGCPFCRLVVDIGDTNLPGDEREVEFWSLKTVLGYEVLTSIEKRGDPGILARAAVVGASAAFYLAVVRSIKPPPRYGFECRTMVKDSIYVGLLSQRKLTGRIDFGIRLEESHRVSFEVVRNWLRRCESHQRCNKISPATGHGLDLKVLDIEQLQLVNLPKGSSYIALSYVLGKAPSSKPQSIYKFSDLPQFFQRWYNRSPCPGASLHLDRLSLHQ